jgi:hypothetical protein
MQKAHDLGHPLHGQPDKEMEIDEFGRLRVVAGQLVEHLIHRQDISVSGRGGQVVREFDPTAIAAPAQPFLAPSALDQDAARSFRGRSEEVTTAFPVLRLGAANEAPVRLVNEG